MPHIVADRLTVEFPLYHATSRSLRKLVIQRASLRLRTDPANRVVVAALREISFRVGRGERVALIGHNGAGKSTLLRTLAGIYQPVAGRLEVSGTIGALIDLLGGIDPNATGRENIVLRCLYRGMSAREARARAEEIGAFSGLGQFLDLPPRAYSAGMAVRLSFAIATMIEPSILLMDEWLAAGDAAFQAQAQRKLEELVADADILILATHNMVMARAWCDRAIRLEQGRIVADGPVGAVAAALEAEAAAAG